MLFEQQIIAKRIFRSLGVRERNEGVISKYYVVVVCSEMNKCKKVKKSYLQ